MNDSNEYVYRLPAIRGIQAGRAFFSVNIPLRVLVNIVKFDDGDNVRKRSQRETNKKRAVDFAAYLQSNPTTFVIPALTGVIDLPLGVEDPIFEESESNPNVGTLIISMAANILLFDGQHRTRGIEISLSEGADIGQSNAPVTLYREMNLPERQQAFADINQNAVKPAQSLSDAYNNRDPLPQLAVKIANQYPFKGLVDFEKNSTSGKSPYLFPLKTIKDATQIFLSLPKNPSVIEEDAFIYAKEFWRKISKSMEWDGVAFTEMSAQEIRSKFLFTHSVMLKATALAGKVMIGQSGSLENVDFSELSKLNFKRDSDDFINRCIRNDCGDFKLMSNQLAVTLTANKMILTAGYKLPPEMKALEKSFES